MAYILEGWFFNPMLNYYYPYVKAHMVKIGIMGNKVDLHLELQSHQI